MSRKHEMIAEPAVMKVGGLELRFSISKSLDVPARGYLEAVTRLRASVETQDVNAIFISTTEACQWLAILAEKDPALKTDADVTALLLVRARAHHHLGSIISRESPSGKWTWRTYDVLPFPDDERFQMRKYVPSYRSRLSDRPLLDVFARLEERISGMAHPDEAAAAS